MQLSDLKERLYALEHISGLTDINDVFKLVDDLFELASNAIAELDKVQGELEKTMKALDQDRSIISILENNI